MSDSASPASPAPRLHTERFSDLSRGRLVMIAGWGVLLWLIVALAILIAPPVLFERGA